MKNNTLIRFFVGMVALILAGACSKTTEPAPPTQCYLATMVDASGKTVEKCTYDINNRLITAAYEDAGLNFDFNYTAQGLVDKLTISDKSTGKVNVFTVAITYDATNKATKAVTSVNGKPYQTNEVSYNANQIAKIVTTDVNANVIATRFEYTGDNVSKVFQKFDGEKEYLYYEITKFDDKKNAYPEAYKALLIGLTGLIDGASFINKNNALEEKYYDDAGIVYYTSQHAFEYNATMYPTKITSNINDDGTKTTEVSTYTYTCK
jgi:hypothetical protein